MRCLPQWWWGLYHIYLFFWGRPSWWSTFNRYEPRFFHVAGGEKGMAFESLWVYLSPFTTLCNVYELRESRIFVWPWRKWNPNLLTSWAFFFKSQLHKCGTRPRDMVALKSPTFYLGGMWKASFTNYYISNIYVKKNQLTQDFPKWLFQTQLGNVGKL